MHDFASLKEFSLLAKMCLLIQAVLASLCLFTLCSSGGTNHAGFSMVISTWAHPQATNAGWLELTENNGTALDAIEKGCSLCEERKCGPSIGYGERSDENGETTLDAMIMDGINHDVGAVGALRRVKSAISVARKILEHTDHTFLVGDQATAFAVAMGFKEENLTTENSIRVHKNWKARNCHPNFWVNVVPDPFTSCGPYTSAFNISSDFNKTDIVDSENHDTIAMIAIDFDGHIAAGTTTNGLKFKIPGRVGDSPIPGSGAYVDKNVGGAAATGNGDIMMRFMPSLVAVEEMKAGKSPAEASASSLKRIALFYPTFEGAVIAVTVNGTYGAACHGYETFPFSVANSAMSNATVFSVTCST